MNYRHSIVLLLLAGALSGTGRVEAKDYPQAYAYGSSIDMQGGFTGSVFRVKGEKGYANGLAAGGNFNLRYTYYFQRHWGVSAGFGLDGASADERSYFKAVNRADGYRYTYESRYSYQPYETSVPVLYAGAAYRYDFGQWSLRPRLGVGLAFPSSSYEDYLRYPRTGIDPLPTIVQRSRLVLYPPYLHDHSYDSGSNATLSLLGSLQLTYTVGHHFFFSLEAGVKAMPAKRCYIMEYTDAKPGYNPQTWVEAVYMDSYKKSWVPDETTTTEVVMYDKTDCLLNFNLGIGWNIGWNRYEKGKLNKKGL